MYKYKLEIIVTTIDGEKLVNGLSKRHYELVNLSNDDVTRILEAAEKIYA